MLNRVKHQFGNQRVSAGSGFAQGSTPTLFTAGALGSYNAVNQLTLQNATYDGVGNQATIGGYCYAFDGEDRMVGGWEFAECAGSLSV